MIWYKINYAPNEQDWTKWECSPIYTPDEAFKRSPPAWICVAELDILRDEGLAYAEKLKSFGVPVTTMVYEGCPHPIMAMDGASMCFFACAPHCLLTVFVQGMLTFVHAVKVR